MLPNSLFVFFYKPYRVTDDTTCKPNLGEANATAHTHDYINLILKAFKDMLGQSEVLMAKVQAVMAS
jgi:hypothetical protein